MDRIKAVIAWRPKIKFLLQTVKELRGWLLPNSHRAIALHVAVTAHRTKTRPRFAELAAQQHQVNDLLDIRHRVFVLRQTHGPAKDHPLGFDKDARSIFELRLLDSRLIEYVAEMGVMQCRL